MDGGDWLSPPKAYYTLTEMEREAPVLSLGDWRATER